jgi:hypothetical protein
MIDSLFHRIMALGMADWSVVLLGVTGVPGLSGYLSPKTIENFSSEQLKNINLDDPLLDIISDLSIDGNLSSADLRYVISGICTSKGLNLEKAKRVWRLVELEQTLSNLDFDPIYGLIKLSEFWSAWGWPADAPSSMKTGLGRTSSQEYHSKENFDQIINEHLQWLVNEKSVVQFLSCATVHKTK